MRKCLLSLAMLFLGLESHASSLTVRDIKLLGQGRVEIQLDGTAAKSALEMEYVRDIVQFSIQNATLYPAKILHTDDSGQAFSKVFAYQYAPNLVRVRFTVDGKADQFQGKVKWEQKGKMLTLTFPEAIAKASPKANSEAGAAHERSLLAKVLATTGGSSGKESNKVEPKITVAPDKLEEHLTKESLASEAKSDGEKNNENSNAENQPILRSDKRKSADAVKLGGARNGPSPLRAFLAMILVVGGLGLTLLYIKRKKGTVQAKKVGDSWISQMLSGNKKPKSFIEVVAVHALGPKQSITVVRIRGQQLVLGVTEGNVQLITQLDSDEEIDLLEDPKLADSIGKIFGGKPAVQPVTEAHVTALRKPAQALAPQTRVSASKQSEASFGNLLKNSTGAGAIVARNAYQSQQTAGTPLSASQRPVPSAVNLATPSSVRDQIKQRLQQGTRN